MKNFLYHLPKLTRLVFFLAIGFLFFNSSTVPAEPKETEVQELKLKVEALKQRVRELEAINKPSVKTKKGKGNRWASLEVGQTKEDVIAILGKAGMTHKWKTGEAWYYPNPKGGEVDFDTNGKVTGWLEP